MTRLNPYEKRNVEIIHKDIQRGERTFVGERAEETEGDGEGDRK